MNALTDRLDEWAALAEKATPGPWTWVTEGGKYRRIRAILDPAVLGCVALSGPADEDAAFIAESRTAVPALVEALRAVLAVCAKADAKPGPDGERVANTAVVKAAIASALEDGPRKPL